jgi:hypothetical protein
VAAIYRAEGGRILRDGDSPSAGSLPSLSDFSREPLLPKLRCERSLRNGHQGTECTESVKGGGSSGSGAYTAVVEKCHLRWPGARARSRRRS